jgi:hypothetical protein
LRGKLLLLLGILGIPSAGLLVPCSLSKGADETVIAATPPMGWNSWDSYGTAVREPEVKAHADYMAKHLGDGDAVNIRVDWRSIGLPALCAMGDLWAKKDMGTIRDGYTFNISPHASALYQVSPVK